MLSDDRASQILISRSEQTVDSTAGVQKVGSIDESTCYGHWTFVKVSTGDIIYLAFGNVEPTANNYHVKLTDDFPVFDDAVVLGDIKALGTIATSRLSTFARGGFWNQKR